MCWPDYMRIETRLLTAIREALPASIPVAPKTAGGVPYGKGAYALVITLRSPVAFAHRGTVHLLQPGCYVYAGNAHGPGGIGARLRRHFRQEKKLHWHVDQLTAVADSIHAFAIEEGSECEIISRLSRLAGFLHPVTGFGSSDCRACLSHLLRYCQ